ncbi:MAG TPA: Panacea domain-containing protein [Vicingaceae bacterium]
MNELHKQYSPEQISKIGNTIIFLASKIDDLSKTKLLKLLYILDEQSIKKSGIPFLNLQYQVWKFGPVSKNIFIELSSSPTILKEYVERSMSDDNTYIVPKVDFCDDEFSKNDIELLEKVVDKFGGMNSTELVSYTHRKGSLWYRVAKENGVLELLENEVIGDTDYMIDLSDLISNDERKKQIYMDFVED